MKQKKRKVDRNIDLLDSNVEIFNNNNNFIGIGDKFIQQKYKQLL